MIGATGFVGRPALEEALGRSELQVTAIARTPERLPAHSRMIARACDVHDADGLAEALRGHDAAIHAYSPGREAADLYARYVAGHDAILGAVKRAGLSRLLAVGGAASLLTPDGVEYLDSPLWNPQFDLYRDAIRGTRALYYMLKDEPELDWVFVAPSEMLRPGERTGRFRYGGDHMLFDAEGRSHISLEDYAMAMVSELVRPRYHRQRFTLGVEGRRRRIDLCGVRTPRAPGRLPLGTIFPPGG